MRSIQNALGAAFAGFASAASPTGLLADFQKSPALGVRSEPRFTWIVPPCGSGNQKQTAYRVVVASETGEQMWDSGKVVSEDSTYVTFAGANLSAGMPYQWTVTTWSTPLEGGEECKSDVSNQAKFITSLFDGWSPSAQFVGLSEKATFAYFRKEVDIPADVVSASAFVTAVVVEQLLSGYPVVVINWVQYLGPPGPFSFPDSRDLLEVLGDFLGRERERGGSLGDPPGP